MLYLPILVIKRAFGFETTDPKSVDDKNLLAIFASICKEAHLMPDNLNVCRNCGGQIIQGDISLRSSRDMEQIMVVRQDHGVEKKIPLQPKICSKCGSISFFVNDPTSLKIGSKDKPVDPNFHVKPILESDF